MTRPANVEVLTTSPPCPNLDNMNTDTPAKSEWITASEAGEILNLHPRTIIRRAESGMLRMTKVPGRTNPWLISREDVERMAKTERRTR